MNKLDEEEVQGNYSFILKRKIEIKRIGKKRTVKKNCFFFFCSAEQPEANAFGHNHSLIALYDWTAQTKNHKTVVYMLHS